ncbi:hypothetical protein [Clostridium sp.]|uniref:hypothetical protein n=1 Tax=Clostridium sp. TaxID=1506 RepID=UPI002FCB7AFB
MVISIAGYCAPWFFSEGYLGYIMGYDYLNLGMVIGYLIVIPSQFVKRRSESLEMLNFIVVILILCSVIYSLLELLDWNMINTSVIDVLKEVVNYGYVTTLISLLGIVLIYIFNYIKKRI